jgi:hypothetical protein
MWAASVAGVLMANIGPLLPFPGGFAIVPVALLFVFLALRFLPGGRPARWYDIFAVFVFVALASIGCSILRSYISATSGRR